MKRAGIRREPDGQWAVTVDGKKVSRRPLSRWKATFAALRIAWGAPVGPTLKEMRRGLAPVKRAPKEVP